MMTASILALTMMLAAATTQHTTTQQNAAPKPEKKTQVTATAPTDGTTSDPLETESYGTGSESDGNPTTTTTTETPRTFRWDTVKPYAVPAIVVLNTIFLALLFAAFILLKRDLQRWVKDLRRQLERLEPKGDPMALVRSDLAKLHRNIDELRQTTVASARFEMPRSAFGASRDVITDEVIPVRREVPRFPVLVSDYLAQRTSRSVRVKATPLDAELFARDLNGEFYLVDDPDGALYVVPAHENITTQFFKTYYRSSYDCNSQGSGDLYLVQPAQVSAKGELWRLTSKGKLEVRVS